MLISGAAADGPAQLHVRGRKTMMDSVHLPDVAADLTEFWSQREIARANGNLFKVAKGIGSTTWHTHDDQDETFLVIEGRITIQLRDRDVELVPGDLFVVPRGTEHRPVAHEEASFLLVGPEITSTAAGGKPAWSHTGTQPPRNADL
jgi:quercetin dioxygenase-like cupin family protein